MRRWIVRGILLLILLVLAVSGVYVYQEYKAFTTPWGTEDDTFIHVIEEGMSARQIAELLHERGVVPNVTAFLIVADLRGIGDELQAGEYEFDGAATPYEILDMLATGYAKRWKLVIPEGFTQLDIANRCEKMEICPKDEFLDYCQTDQVFGWVVAQPPGGAAAGTEGTLFPDTYLFTKNTPTKKVFNRMRKRFVSVWEDLMMEIENEEISGLWWQDNRLTPREQALKVLTMASIVEKEAKRDQDRAKIASVFVNRLEKNMPLQSDATIHYFLDDWSRPLTKKDTQRDSPYNTYKNTGLPPAPICNPGRKSMVAAMRPEKTDYIFFISQPDGSIKFTTNHRDHVNLKNEMKRNGDL